jgi:hypothetical protein
VLRVSSAISGHPDIPCFLLLEDPINELLLSLGLGGRRILTPRLADPLTRNGGQLENIRANPAIPF